MLLDEVYDQFFSWQISALNWTFCYRGSPPALRASEGAKCFQVSQSGNTKFWHGIDRGNSYFSACILCIWNYVVSYLYARWSYPMRKHCTHRSQWKTLCKASGNFYETIRFAKTRTPGDGSILSFHLLYMCFEAKSSSKRDPSQKHAHTSALVFAAAHAKLKNSFLSATGEIFWNAILEFTSSLYCFLVVFVVRALWSRINF